MTLWTYRDDQSSWLENSNGFVALCSILQADWNGRILITTQQILKDKESICAILRMVRQAHANACVIVGVPYASIELFDLFKSNGATDIWVVNLRYSRQSAKPYMDITERIPIDRPICPALHIQKGDPVELSVCGKRNDRLILVMSYFRKWCVADYESCPYWRGTYAP